MRVSIGLPFYNAQRTLADAIRSIFAQTIDDWELILVDDGSSDGSADIARAVSDPRVRVVSGGVNKGLPCRLNQIARLAKGEYIARMDADDLMHPDRLALQLQYLDANPTVDVVFTAIYTIDENNIPVGARSFAELDLRPKALLRHALAAHVTMMGRVEWFRDNLYDGNFVRAEDHELWCRTYGHTAFDKIRQPLLFVREPTDVNLNNYLHSCKTDRKIFKIYGPSMVGWPTTIELVVKSHLKGQLYRVFTALGKQDALLRMRNNTLSEHEKETAAQVIQHILAAHVPGFTAYVLREECLM
ncbi:MAG: glycosyltransferase family 2 protein [Actinobacteria bacterium]|nr:glycosyltransferase family 2 protein [Actinomycetota bacterium]